jgi:threonylcarbamoyladenosine tRNA methylthiotransferase MtaB
VRNFFVQNFGCRATQADGAALETLLAAKGLEAAAERSNADLVVLNTCTVTQAADEDVRQTAPPRASREPRGPHPGDRLLRTARAR